MSRSICTRLAQPGALPTTVRIYFIRTCFAILLATSALAQTAAPPTAFEAASVKLNTGSAFYQNMGTGQIEMRSFPLKILITMAYGGRVSGPDWLDSVKLDVAAKLPPSVSAMSPKDRARMVGVMMQGLLADRVKLKVHLEEKVVPGYALVVMPGGSKMRRVEGFLPGGVVGPGSITAKGMEITQIVVSVRGTLGMPVQDMTGLSGYYEFSLTWTPEDKVLASADNTSPDPGDRPPSIFTALQEQLGLKLEPRQLPIQITVVDHVEKVPTEN
jgi:uncharacterized protein (TIGR03435 family)